MKNIHESYIGRCSMLVDTQLDIYNASNSPFVHCLQVNRGSERFLHDEGWVIVSHVGGGTWVYNSGKCVTLHAWWIAEVGNQTYLTFLIVEIFLVWHVRFFMVAGLWTVNVSDRPAVWRKMWKFDEAFVCEVTEFFGIIALRSSCVKHWPSRDESSRLGRDILCTQSCALFFLKKMDFNKVQGKGAFFCTNSIKGTNLVFKQAQKTVQGSHGHFGFGNLDANWFKCSSQLSNTLSKRENIFRAQHCCREEFSSLSEFVE